VINLKRIFEDLSLKLVSKNDKQFDSFILNNTTLTELGDNIFHDITFKSIRLSNAPKLSHISSKAFSAFNIETVERFVVNGYSSLDDEKYINDTFTALSSLKKLEEIDFSETNLSIIPSHAFKHVNGAQDKLSTLNFERNKIKSVENNAFYYLMNLTRLYLEYNIIDHIAIHAFDFYNSTKEQLYIGLFCNKLNDTSIEIGAFTDSKKSFAIDLRGNEFTFLNERIFGPILRTNSKNLLYIDDIFTCDCRMFWIFKQKNTFMNQISGRIRCNNDKVLWSLTDSDFSNCNE
jgi:Leucine-rich repeat (LRR) protein